MFLPPFLRRADLLLSSQLGQLGTAVARSPLAFLLVPLLITALLATGFQQFFFLANTEYLFVPTYARSLEDRAAIEQIFPDSLDNYLKGGTVRLPVAVDLNLVPRELGPALREEVWREAAALVSLVEQVRVEAGGREAGWQELCARFAGRCVDNSFLELVDSEAGLSNLSFPLHREGREERWFPLVAHLGGVTLQGGKILDARAMKVTFVLGSGEDEAELRTLWLLAVERLLASLSLHHCEVFVFWSGVLEKELVGNIQDAMTILPLTVFMMAAYTVINCLSTDWVTAKPLLGAAGLLTVCLAMVSGFGLAMYLGFPWQAINLVAVFLLLGIGLDSVFIILSSWARSAAHSKDVVTRVSVTFAEVAVSLTITSLTNVLGFMVGALMPGFPGVQLFCVYASLGLVFNYLWMLTIFGSFLTWAGHLEQANRHCLLLTPVLPKDRATSFLYLVLMSGGQNYQEEVREQRVKAEKMMVFFRDVFSPFLSKTSTKTMVFLAFGCYVAISLLGVAKLELGLDKQRLVSDHSSLVPYFRAQDRYFRDFPYRLQLVIPDPLDYHNRTVQTQVFDLLHKLEELPLVSNITDFRQSWLHVFLDLARENFLVFNLTTSAQFQHGLQAFLSGAAKHPVSYDVRLSEDGGTVEASRFYLQTSRVADAQEEIQLLAGLREVTDAAPFRVIVYNPLFPIFDQYSDVLPQTIQTVLICISVMAVVTLVFIPNRGSVAWVIFTIFSVELGVVGFMAHWGVNLDVISMIQLIMGIGFSVDCSAHISYHYLASDAHLPSHARLSSCLFSMGPPVLQGATTTILGVLPLLFQPSYVTRTFSKVILLVILLGLVHSLFLLPTLLTLAGPGSCGRVRARKRPLSESVLSPNTVVSDTFVYRREKVVVPSLRKQALERRERQRIRTRSCSSVYCSKGSTRPSPAERTGIDNPLFCMSPESGGLSPHFDPSNPDPAS